MDATCPNDCNRHGVCQDGTCLCDFGRMGEDCGHEGEDAYSRVLSCALEHLQNCSGHGACQVNDDRRSVSCECGLGYYGQDCSLEHPPDGHLSIDCKSQEAEACVSAYISAACPESDFSDFAVANPQCDVQNPCLLKAKHDGRCPFTSGASKLKPLNKTQLHPNMTIVITEFCNQSEAR